jgi:hypothetical protein
MVIQEILIMVGILSLIAILINALDLFVLKKKGVSFVVKE